MIYFLLITMGAKSAADLANEIRSSLHFDSFSWNLFWLDLAISPPHQIGYGCLPSCQHTLQ